MYLIGGGLHPLLARDFAPLAVRLASVASRLEGVPALIEVARRVLGSVAERPVSRLHAEVAGRRIGGVAALGREAVTMAEAAAPDDPETALLLPRLRVAAERAAAVLEGIGRHLGEEVAPGAAGGPLLGRQLFERKLRHTLRDPSATPDAILARAKTEYVAVRGEMVRLARELWPVCEPARRRPVMTRRRSGGCSTPSPPITRRPRIWWRSAGRSSARSRRSAAITT